MLAIRTADGGVKFHHLVTRFFMRVSYNRRVDGLWVGSIGDKSEAPLLDKVEVALQLIEQYDPVRYRRIRRDIDRIWINGLIGALGSFDKSLKLCNLDRKFVETSDPAAIASTIVHEATHGHPCLRKLGYPEALRHRIEQVCFRQEIAFGRRLPDGEVVIEQAERQLTRPAVYWLDEEFKERWPGQALAKAREAGIPNWVAKALIGAGESVAWCRRALRFGKGRKG
jgi:hypothetical protein